MSRALPVHTRPVADDQWAIVGWMWECFRHDLARIVHGFPYPDGRYRHDWLDEYPTASGAGYLAWSPHPPGGQRRVGSALD